jgi:hypothetical protein
MDAWTFDLKKEAAETLFVFLRRRQCPSSSHECASVI